MFYENYDVLNFHFQFIGEALLLSDCNWLFASRASYFLVAKL